MRNWISAFAITLCATSLVHAQAAAPAKPAPSAPQAPAATRPDRDTPAQSQPLPSARSIIDKYVQAIGGRRAILAHSSSHATGTLNVPSQGITGNIEIYSAKPNKSLVKTTIG